ncbi:MAG: hypothetical protein J6S49_02810 [Erysipelotrichaceae bacterium]|nr:hypothetical protein [Erysipelotrichaceae bacterium]
MVNKKDFINDDDTLDIPDFVEDKTTTDSSVDMSIFKMSDDELYDDNSTEEDEEYDEDYRPVRKKGNSSTSLIICLILIVVLLATTIGALIYGVKQHNSYVKVNTENVQLKANEDNYKKQIADKDATIANLTAQLEQKESGTPSGGQGKLIYEITDGPMHFRVSPTSDADTTTYNGASLANNGEKYNVIEIVNDKDLGDKVKWAKIADNIYFCVNDNGNVYAKQAN